MAHSISYFSKENLPITSKMLPQWSSKLEGTTRQKAIDIATNIFKTLLLPLALLGFIADNVKNGINFVAEKLSKKEFTKKETANEDTATSAQKEEVIEHVKELRAQPVVVAHAEDDLSSVDEVVSVDDEIEGVADAEEREVEVQSQETPDDVDIEADVEELSLEAQPDDLDGASGGVEDSGDDEIGAATEESVETVKKEPSKILQAVKGAVIGGAVGFAVDQLAKRCLPMISLTCNTKEYGLEPEIFSISLPANWGDFVHTFTLDKGLGVLAYLLPSLGAANMVFSEKGSFLKTTAYSALSAIVMIAGSNLLEYIQMPCFASMPEVRAQFGTLSRAAG
jgi:hypothetical protein